MTLTAGTTSVMKRVWNAEFVLRRQLQTGNENEAEVDSNMYAHTQTQSSEESSQSRGRTVLTILYLCVLGLCFVVPVFYYFRLHCFEENARRELELDFTTALEQSEQHREESRAARRKYIEERRARILQLLGPVRIILKDENFPQLTDDNAPKQNVPVLNLDFESEKYAVKSYNESATRASDDVFLPYTSDDDDPNEQAQRANNNNSTKRKKEADDNTAHNDAFLRQRGGVIKNDGESHNDGAATKDDNWNQKMTDRQHNPYGDEDTFFVQIPVPGLPMGGSCFSDPARPQRHQNTWDRETRLTPGLCTICLSNYKVGSDVVWSSNQACDHHFHTLCIERWLMKQREGALCPCCRRDFIVDPLDALEEEGNNKNSDDNNQSYLTEGQRPLLSWDPEEEFAPVIVTAPGDGAGTLAYNQERLEEGLNLRAAQSIEAEQTNEPTTEIDVENTNIKPSLNSTPPRDPKVDAWSSVQV